MEEDHNFLFLKKNLVKIFFFFLKNLEILNFFTELKILIDDFLFIYGNLRNMSPMHLVTRPFFFLKNLEILNF